MSLSYSKLFEPTVLTTSAATMFTVSNTNSNNLLRQGRVRFTNTTAGAVSVTAYAVPLAGAAADGNAILKGKSIPANDYIDVDLPLMKAGDFLQALAGAATSITAHLISGVVFAP